MDPISVHRLTYSFSLATWSGSMAEAGSSVGVCLAGAWSWVKAGVLAWIRVGHSLPVPVFVSALSSRLGSGAYLRPATIPLSRLLWFVVRGVASALFAWPLDVADDSGHCCRDGCGGRRGSFGLGAVFDEFAWSFDATAFWATCPTGAGHWLGRNSIFCSGIVSR